MSVLRITKIFSFEAAHALKDYNGPCRNIHGHSYKLWVTIKGNIDPKTGRILDVGDLKKIVNEAIICKFDHSLILSEADQKMQSQSVELMENLVLLTFNPSSENLVLHFSNLLIGVLPEYIELHSLKLYETETSFAEWYAGINNKMEHFKN